MHKLRREQARQASEHLKVRLPHSLKRSMDLAQEKGASSWLTALPIEEFGFALHKGAFHDVLALRYNWQPLHTPSTCGCGAEFSVEHALSCPKGVFPSIRHNEIRDLTANLLHVTEVCSDVCIEPDLQPITGEVLTGATSNAPPMVSGEVGSKEHSSLSEFSILMPPPTDSPVCLPVIANRSP